MRNYKKVLTRDLPSSPSLLSVFLSLSVSFLGLEIATICHESPDACTDVGETPGSRANPVD